MIGKLDLNELTKRYGKLNFPEALGGTLAVLILKLNELVEKVNLLIKERREVKK